MHPMRNDHHAVARRRAQRRRRRVPGRARARRPRPASAPTASPTCCTTTSSAPSCGATTIPTRAATRLVDAANRAGGVDNITVVIVERHRRGARPRATRSRTARCSSPNWSTSRPPTRENRAKARRFRGQGRRVGRTLLWVIPVLLIIAIGLGAIAWYARNNYFVAANPGRVTVYKGVPGGLLWLEPDHRAAHQPPLADLRPVDAVNVRRGEQTFDSKSRRRRVRPPDPPRRASRPRRPPPRPRPRPTTTTVAPPRRSPPVAGP